MLSGVRACNDRSRRVILQHERALKPTIPLTSCKARESVSGKQKGSPFSECVESILSRAVSPHITGQKKHPASTAIAFQHVKPASVSFFLTMYFHHHPFVEEWSRQVGTCAEDHNQHWWLCVCEMPHAHILVRRVGCIELAFEASNRWR